MIGIRTMGMAVGFPMAISATFGIEWCIDPLCLGAQFDDHFLNHMILADAEAIFQQLGWQMTITQMPGNAHKMRRISAGDIHDRFVLGLDENATSVFQNQNILVPQGGDFRKVQEELRSALSRQPDTAAAAAFKVQDDRIDQTPVKSRFLVIYFRCMLHGLIHEIALCHGKFYGGLTGQQLSIRMNNVGFRIHIDFRCFTIMDHR